ncbi:MAG: hypothetical protein ACI87E_001327, partial [Mariniblastus sp.]
GTTPDDEMHGIYLITNVTIVSANFFWRNTL